jgi:threonine/homoserine/homoserine lactone efflux protein
MLATGAGLSTLFDAVPVAYDIVRLAGAAYLLWLSVRFFHTRGSPFATLYLSTEGLDALYRRGFITCLLNPKIVLMYGSLLPQFIQTEAGSVFAQTIELGLIQIVAAASAHSCVIFGASRVSAFFSRSLFFAGAQRYLLSGLLAAVAIRILFEGRRLG